MTWQPIDLAPKDGTPVVVWTRGGSVLLAYFGQRDDFSAWMSATADEYPRSWDDGVCWEFNSDYEQSDPPILWAPAPTPELDTDLASAPTGMSQPEIVLRAWLKGFRAGKASALKAAPEAR